MVSDKYGERSQRGYPVRSLEVPEKKKNMAAGSSAGRNSPSSGRFRNNLRQKSREYKESSDSEDDELFDGEKLKTRLMSMWNNMRHGK